MRICPNCGHEEHPVWRPRKSRVFCEYVKTETLEYNLPDLFTKIKEAYPVPYFDGHFVYHITKSGLNVERIERSLHEIMGWGRDGEPEKVNHSALAFVKPLTEFIKKEGF